MDIEKYRKEFVIFVVDGDFTSGEQHASSLRAIGYEAKTFPTVDSALVAAKVSPPHLTVFNLAALEVVGDHFLNGMAEISSEIVTILLIGQKQVLTGLQHVGHGRAFDFVVCPMASTLELTQAVDRGAGQLFHQFENEQLREQAPRSGEKPEEAAAAGSEARTSSALAEFNEFQVCLAATKDLEPTVQAFMDALSRRLGNAPSLYFKFLPQHRTLAVAQSAWLPIEKLRGVGVDLSGEDASLLSARLASPDSLAPLRALLSQAFRLESYMAFAHILDDEPVGVFVVFAEARGAPAEEAVRAMRLAFESTYKRNQTLKEKHALDVYDSATGLLCRRTFSEEIDKEVIRARRILLPVSLVCIGVDGFSDAPGEEAKGPRGHSEAVVKVIAAILKKTARINDFIGRTGPAEMMLLLPHTAALGAAMKGERARKAVETMRFPPLDGLGPVSVSVGVSEYPAFCPDSEGLLKSADDAFWQVKRAGGNKVCLATAAAAFVPDFVPAPQQPATLVPSSFRAAVPGRAT